MNINELNVLVLAYMGDSIYEKYVREKLINDGIGNVNDLQSKSIMYVSAKGQAKYIQEMINNDILDSNEIDIVKRARNNRSNSHPKNCDIVTYKYATGLEALIGYLYLSGNTKRIDEIMNYILR